MRRLLALAAFACALAAAPASAQQPQPAAARPPPSPELNAITDVADALGMIRGTQREWRSVNRIYFIASGTMARPGEAQPLKLTRGFIEMSFAQHAIRCDLTLQRGRAEPTRLVEVARGDVAWNETTPGVDPKPAAGQAKARLANVYASPHGAVRTAMEAIVKDKSSLRLTVSGAAQTFDVASPAGPLRIVTDGKRPARTELTTDAGKLVSEFSDYRDWENLGVWFPARIKQTLDGKPLADLTVSEFRTNPYVIFPWPPGMAPPGASNSQH